MEDLEIDYAIEGDESEVEQSQYYSPIAAKKKVKLPLSHLNHYRMKAHLSVAVVSAFFAAAIFITTLMMRIVLVPPGAMAGNQVETFTAASLGLVFSIVDILFGLLRLYLGKYKPHYNIYSVLIANIVVVVLGFGVLAGLSYFLWRFVIYFTVGIPYFGLVVTILFLECSSVARLVEYRNYYKGKREVLSEKSISSSKALHVRLIISMVLHLLIAVPGGFYIFYRDRIFLYLPIAVGAYIIAILLLNILGMFGALQTSEPPQLIIFFIASLVISFFGVYVILLVSMDASMYELGIHPIAISLPFFVFALIAWLFQLTCSHRAWLLLKYKQELRKNLEVRYSTVDGSDMADHVNDTLVSGVGSINRSTRPFSHRMTSEYTMSTITTDSSDPHGTDDEYHHGSDEQSQSAGSGFSFDEVMKFF